MGDKRNISLQIILLIVFALIFFIALMSLEHEQALFDIGMPALYENWIIIFLSIGSIIKIVWELYKN